MVYPQIKNLRSLRDFKQEYVANFLGISQPEYSRLESGARLVKGYELERLAELYGIRVDQLMNNEKAIEVASSSVIKPFRRSESVPKEIVDRLIDNNGELLRNLLEHQVKTDRIIDKLFHFIEKRSSDSTYYEVSQPSPVNEEFNNLRTTEK